MTHAIKTTQGQTFVSLVPAAAGSAAPSPTAAPPFFNPTSLDNPVPPDFFTSREEECLKKMFQSYRLTSKLCLIDLLGFDFYQHLQDLTALIPSKEDHESLQKRLRIFSRNFVGLYLRLLRTGLVFFEDSSTAMDKFSISPAEFVESLETTYKTASTFVSKAASQPASTAQERLKKANFLKNHYRASLEHLTHLATLKDIYSKILASQHCIFLLVDCNVQCFQGHDSLDAKLDNPVPTLKSSEIPGINDLRKYFSFLVSALEVAEADGAVSAKTTAFPLQLSLLKSCINDPISIDFIQQWNRIFHQLHMELDRSDKLFKSFYREAKAGRLTHQQWCETQGKKVAFKKTQEEFTESLRISITSLTIFHLWEEDINLMIEDHAFCPLFPSQYRSKNKTLIHFIQTLEDLIKKPIAEPAACEDRSSIHFVTTSFARRIHEASQPPLDFLLQQDLFESFAFLLGKIVARKRLTYVECAQFLQQLHPGCAMTEELCKKLPEIKKETEQNLRDFLKTVSPEDFAREKKQWLQQLRADYIERLGSLFVLVTFFRDLQVFSEKKTFVTDWDYIIGPDLRDLFALIDQIDVIFAETELQFQKAKEVSGAENREPSVEKSSAAASEKTAAEEEKSSPSVASEITPSAASAKTDVPEPRSEPITTPAALELESSRAHYQAVITRLKLAAKRREFVVILKELGFNFARYGKGSHEIWEDDSSNQVVLPFHNGRDGLKAGTQHSVIKQITASLNPES